MNEDYLCHHGVKGMKWGVRKKRPQSSGISSALSRRKEARAKAKAARKAEKKRLKEVRKENNKTSKVHIKDLTDAELQNKIRRLQMEKQYRDLKRDEVSTGKKLVGEILKTSGKTVGVQVVNYVAGKAINKAFNDRVVNVGQDKKKKKNKEAA